MSDMFLCHIIHMKGCQTLVKDPTSLLQQSLVNAVPHTIMVHWYLLWWGQVFQDLTYILLVHFWWHIIDVWHVLMSYYNFEGLSDLGNWPNQPPATIIGECSASYHHGALVFTLGRARSSGSDIILTTFLMTHHWCLTCSHAILYLWRVVRPC
jgi:hypothetical protein